MKYFTILFICLGYFLTCEVWATHRGHRRSRQPHPGHRPPPGPGHPQNAPIDLEALDALGIQRPPPGRMISLNKPDQARYDAFIENKRKSAAAPQEDQNAAANGNPYNAGEAEVDPNTLEKDKDEIIAKLENQAEDIISDEEGGDPLPFNGADSMKVYFSLMAVGALSFLISFL